MFLPEGYASLTHMRHTRNAMRLEYRINLCAVECLCRVLIMKPTLPTRPHPLSRSIVGWSVYDVFLENWMVHFVTTNTTATTDATASMGQQQQQQLMVLYTDDLAARPMVVVNKVGYRVGLASGQAKRTQRQGGASRGACC